MTKKQRFTMKEKAKIKRHRKSFAKLARARTKLVKARAERIWIENNPQIHILNYPFHKLKRKLTRK